MSQPTSSEKAGCQVVALSRIIAAARPIASDTNRRGRALMMRIALGSLECAAGSAVAMSIRRPFCSASGERLLEQPRPLGALVEVARHVDENQPGGRRLDLR